MDPFTAVGVETIAAVAAAAALAAATATVGTYRSVRRTERAVFGAAVIEHDDGLAGQVAENSDRLDTHASVLYGEGYLAMPDGGEDPAEATEVAGIELPDAENESGTERDGVLSYAGEWHALLIGAAAGAVGIVTGQVAILGGVATVALGIEGGKRAGSKALSEVGREPWYALAGILAGLPLGTGITVIL
jgi:hypothetical protein